MQYASAYRLRQMPNGLIAREALHLRAAPEDREGDEEASSEQGPRG